MKCPDEAPSGRKFSTRVPGFNVVLRALPGSASKEGIHRGAQVGDF